MKYFNLEIIKTIVKRIFASKIVLGTFFGLIAKAVLMLFETDITPLINNIVDALWSLWILYAAANNPTTPDQF